MGRLSESFASPYTLLQTKMAQVMLLSLLLAAASAQEFSWGASDYYMGWQGGQSWESSRSSCQNRGSGWDLASITTSAENRGLESIMLDYCAQEQGDLALCCFLMGGYDIDSATSMSWVSGEDLAYTNWYSSQIFILS